MAAGYFWRKYVPTQLSDTDLSDDSISGTAGLRTWAGSPEVGKSPKVRNWKVRIRVRQPGLGNREIGKRN